MNALREELTKLLEENPGSRRAVLRRSLRKDYLYATDLPAAAGERETESFIRGAKSHGWRVLREKGWIELDRPYYLPPVGLYIPPGGEEALCCASLLRRHPPRADVNAAGAEAARSLIKAAECGEAEYEKAWRMLHIRMAEMLRLGEELPALSEKFFD